MNTEKNGKIIGEYVHNYEIIKKIKEGGMGAIYTALDKKLNRTVVLKFLLEEYIRDRESKERFLLEARATAALNHPNIVTIYEINEYNNQMYIAMEFIDGETLLEKVILAIKKGKINLQIKNIIDITIHICEGLKKAHHHGIIHRDIKPQNIMVDREGRVKILDFGTAKLKGAKRLTKKFFTLGTFQYMSPEQLNADELDQRTDIWSLGVVLYEMLTGQLPFSGEDPQTVFYSIMNKNPEPISQIRPDIPDELEHILDKTLTKDRDNRYQRIDHLIEDLKSMGRDPLHLTVKRIPIAVLAFVDMSRKQDQEYFCDGIAEELINFLTKIDELKVTSRTASFQFKGRGSAIQEISQKLKVKYILEGSVQKSKRQLRITTNLINTKDESYIWSEKFDRKMKDIFAIQDEITHAVVNNLKVKLLGEEKSNLTKRHTSDQEAYNLFLKGRYFWNKRYEGGLQKSIGFYKKAIEKDPVYALPYVGIADSLNIAGFYGYIPPVEAFTEAKRTANKALEIDNTLTEAHVSLGWISNFYDWDWDEAEKKYKRAIELNPNYATAHEWYALSLATRGQFDEAISEARLALDLDPLSLIINSVLGLIYLFSRKYDEAKDQLIKTLEMDPNFLLAHIWLGEIYMVKKMYKEAIKEFELAVSISKEMTYAMGDLGLTYAFSGEKNKANQIISRLDQLAEERYIPLLPKSLVYLGLNQLDHVFELLEMACEKRDPFCLWLKSAPHFDSISLDPRFKALLKRIGFD